MKKKPTAALVIPFYNEALYIKPTLRSLVRQRTSKNTSWTTVFVDNGSTDASKHIIETYYKKHKLSHLMVKEPRKGTAYSRITGLRKAALLKPDILISTDADTVLPTTFIESTRKDMEAADALCGKRRAMPKIELWRKTKSKTIYNTYRKIWNLEYSIFGPYFFGAFFAVKTSLFQKLTLLPPREYVQYLGEDILIARRCRFLGASFIQSSTRVSPSPRRIITNQSTGLGTYVGNESKPYKKQFSTASLDFRPMSVPEEKKAIAQITHFAARRLLWSIADAYVFWVENAMIHTHAQKSAAKGFDFIGGTFPRIVKPNITRGRLFRQLLKNNYPKTKQSLERYI